MSTVVLSVRGVGHHYCAPDGARLDILRDVDLDVPAGEVTALVGPSGSGKSTLLAIAGLLLTPAAGSVTVAGRLIGRGERERTTIRRDHVGFVFQAAHLVPQLTALENVCLPLLASRGPVDRQTGIALLREVGLADRADHLPGQLSGGEAQRVATCRALVNGPDLLLADEPTGSLDPDSAEALRVLLRSVAERGVGVLVATHDPLTLKWADHAVGITAGRLAAVTTINPGGGVL